MQVQVKPWGNSQGIRFSKDFLRRAGIGESDVLDARIENGSIILTPGFRHQSLRERAEAYGGELRLSDEIIWDEPKGSEVW